MRRRRGRGNQRRLRRRGRMRRRAGMGREDTRAVRKGVTGGRTAFRRMSRVLVHRRVRLHHGEERARRITHELILRRGEHGLVVRVKSRMRGRIRKLGWRLVHHAHGMLCGHRVLSDVRSALTICVLGMRGTLEGGSSGRGSRPIFLGRGRVERCGRGLESRTRGRATRLRHTSAAVGLPAKLGSRARGA